MRSCQRRIFRTIAIGEDEAERSVVPNSNQACKTDEEKQKMKLNANRNETTQNGAKLQNLK